jgi:uncharacterized protein YbjT (DUF2867 family)
MIYLITGATGTVGSLVVEQLLERGYRPRIFVRDQAKAHALFGDRVDVFTGDLADGETLGRALRGSDAVLLVNSGPKLAAHDEAAANIAKARGVKHLVKLSSSDAREHVGTGVWHAQGEAAIRACGIGFTFLQPSGFMSNALFWAKSIGEERVVRSCTGHGKIPFIHPRDIAEVAAEVLVAGSFRGESLPITGSEALSYAEMALKIGAAMGEKIRFESISEEEVRQMMIASGDSEEVIEAHLSIYRAISEGRLAKVTDTVEGILGRKPITFDQWVQENASTFAHPVPRMKVPSMV